MKGQYLNRFLKRIRSSPEVEVLGEIDAIYVLQYVSIKRHTRTYLYGTYGHGSHPTCVKRGETRKRLVGRFSID